MKIEVDEKMFMDMIETIEVLDEAQNCRELSRKARELWQDQTTTRETDFSPEC